MKIFLVYFIALVAAVYAQPVDEVEIAPIEEKANSGEVDDSDSSSSSSSSSEEAPFLKEMIECAEEMNITPEKLLIMVLMDEESRLSCFGSCVMKKVGILDGKVLKDKIDEFIKNNVDESPEEVQKLADTCIEKANAEADECSTAGEFIGCILSELSEDKRKKK